MATSARILVVDDERVNLDLCVRKLQRSGYVADQALSGPQALEMVKNGSYEVILLDYMMPGMSGIDVLKSLRAEYEPLDLSIIMATAVCDSEKISEALDLGANDYITKPIDFNVALARIRSQVTNMRREGLVRVTKERYTLAAKGAGSGLWDWDLERDSLYLCSDWKWLLGYAPEEIGEYPEAWYSLIHPSDVERFKSTLRAHIESFSKDLNCDYRIKTRDGSYRWMSLNGAAVRNAEGRATRVVGSQNDITERATTDCLTQLPNRVALIDRLSLAIARQQSHSDQRCAVMILNLDRFKLFNDSLGIASGDRMLTSIAKRLHSALDESIKMSSPEATSFVARLRGDEFAVLVEDLDNAATAESLAASIARVMRQAFREGDREFYCTFSIGIVFALADIPEEEILRNADIAMCVAKARGQGKWVEFNASMQKDQFDRLMIENDLRMAVQKSQFEVYYQPIVCLATQNIQGLEALVRWNHPERGLISPAVFIPVAEQTGMICEIGMWVLEEACRQTHIWNTKYATGSPYYVAVNLSARQCEEPGFVEKVAGILRTTGLQPECLHLELTESMFVEEMVQTRRMLQALKNLNVGLKIDDFGTGYSNLKHLAKLPFDMLKIDQSFVREMDDHDRDSIELVRSILMMAKGLNLEVIAEGIEVEQQLKYLNEMGCAFGQGYLFAKPAPAEAVEKTLAASQITSIDR